ncbi:unnamed protein product [Protopolystoma xenopodis]|uniref:Uncharacterized protein n=1 Tax=Protopolystoma xenopodis TaxID=117903 RepID=A0A448X839_9PLAT|nr:unnamed protein product [Protopolystoma xenopodis]
MLLPPFSPSSTFTVNTRHRLLPSGKYFSLSSSFGGEGSLLRGISSSHQTNFNRGVQPENTGAQSVSLNRWSITAGFVVATRLSSAIHMF